MKSAWVLRVGAAEFPHHNVAIDRGTLWIGTAMGGAEKALEPPPREMPEARAKPLRKRTTILPPPDVAPSNPPTGAAIQELAEGRGSELGATPAAAQGNVEPSSETSSENAPKGAETDAARSDSPIDTFLRAVAEVACAHGPAESAAHVESLFMFGTPAPLDLAPDARAALLDGNILEADQEGVHVTAWFSNTSSAWQKMLRGESGDLGVCGDATLDGWTADLVARLVAKPNLASAIRRDLRRRGIAAFGMLDAR
ncbi:MAG: hypothetical protein ABW133_01575 [Polyangiaceae bacterium]